MSRRYNGGPAFPRPTSTDEHDIPCNVYQDQEGMSLRDWFAGQTLVAMGTWSPEIMGDNEDSRIAARARYAYAQADAMLKAREGERSWQ